MCYKTAQVLLPSKATFLYNKAVQVVLQIRAGIRNWGRYYKAGQLLKRTAKQSTW